MRRVERPVGSAGPVLNRRRLAGGMGLRVMRSLLPGKAVGAAARFSMSSEAAPPANSHAARSPHGKVPFPEVVPRHPQSKGLQRSFLQARRALLFHWGCVALKR